MENIVFTQLSVQEVRQMLREEVQTALKEFQPLQKSDEGYELMTIQDLAQYINMAVPSVYGLVHQKENPSHQAGQTSHIRAKTNYRMVTIR